MIEALQVCLRESGRTSLLLHRQQLVILCLDHLGELIRAQRLLPNLVFNDINLGLLLQRVLLVEVDEQLELLLDLIQFRHQVEPLVDQALLMLIERLQAVLLQSTCPACQVAELLFVAHRVPDWVATLVLQVVHNLTEAAWVLILQLLHHTLRGGSIVVREGSDDLAKGKQRLVDFNGFIHGRA